MLGFGYPLHEFFLALLSSEASFSSQHSWAFLFKAFLLPEGRSTLSNQSLRSCSSFQNLSGFRSKLQRLSPFEEAVPLFAPYTVNVGQGLLLS